MYFNELVDAHVDPSYAFIQDMMVEMHEEDPHKAVDAFRAVIHSLRDRLSVQEAAELGSHFPYLIRGIYYEDYHPIPGIGMRKFLPPFLSDVSRRVGRADVDPYEGTRAVLQVVHRHVRHGVRVRTAFNRTHPREVPLDANPF